MIDYLRGTVVEVDVDSIVVDVGGVGYRVYCPAPERFRRPDDGPVLVYTHLHVKEDEWLLYGFPRPEERALFRQLLAVSGIGPKLALSILGATGYGEIAAAIAGENVEWLTRLPGIGKKTAQRLIVELKDKVEVPWPEAAPPLAMTDGPPGGPGPAGPWPGGLWREVALALQSLGYKEAEIRPVVQELARETEEGPPSPERALRRALQRLDTYRRIR